MRNASKLLPLKPTLTRFWDLQKFSGKRRQSTGFEDDDDSEWKSNIEKLNGVILDKLFWTRVRLVHKLGFVGEYVGRWSEGCPCHEKELIAGLSVDCPYKQCRAPEFACGDSFEGLDHQLEMFKDSVLPICTSEGIQQKDHQPLVLLAGKVCAGLFSELRLKFGYWTQLPHCLCGLAHHKPAQACLAAQNCLKAFDGVSPGSLHQMTRRFLDPKWNAPGEKPLHPYLVRMSQGESLTSINDELFTHWVTALGTIKVVERPVEGIHSRISRSTRASPNQSMSLISFALRFGSLVSLLQEQPRLLDLCQEDILMLERSDGFQSLVQKHLGLDLRVQNASDRDMSNLLYRENARLKHSKKSGTNRVLSEHSSINTATGQSRPVTAAADAQIAGAHLAKIVCADPGLFFLVPHELFRKCMIPLEQVASGGQTSGNASLSSLEDDCVVLTGDKTEDHHQGHICRAVRPDNMSRLQFEGLAGMRLRDCDMIVEKLDVNDVSSSSDRNRLNVSAATARVYLFAWTLDLDIV